VRWITTKQRAFITAAAAVALLSSVAAPAQAQRPAHIAHDSNGVLIYPVVVTELWVKALDPALDADTKSQEVVDMLYSGLVKLDGNNNVVPDLAAAMKQNPNLKVQLNGGYFDLATPFFAAQWELQQLPMQQSLQANTEMHFYTSGHMVYAHEPDLKALHDNVAAFINKTH